MEDEESYTAAAMKIMTELVENINLQQNMF